MLGFTPNEFTVVLGILALAAAYDLSRTSPKELPLKRLRMAICGFVFLASGVALRHW